MPRFDERRGLRVVNDYKLGVQREVRAISFVVSEENFEILRTGMIGRAMQRIVEGFGHVEEVLAPAHHVPFDVETQFFRERYQAI